MHPCAAEPQFFRLRCASFEYQNQKRQNVPGNGRSAARSRFLPGPISAPVSPVGLATALPAAPEPRPSSRGVFVRGVAGKAFPSNRSRHESRSGRAEAVPRASPTCRRTGSGPAGFPRRAPSRTRPAMQIKLHLALVRRPERIEFWFHRHESTELAVKNSKST